MIMHPTNTGAAPPLSCDELIAQLWDFLDGELSAQRQHAFEAHLAGCIHCAGHVAFERSFLKAIALGREDALDAERLTARVRQALVSAGLSDPR